MAFKSEAQRRKFAELVKEGKISKSTFDEWESKTPDQIPDRISSKVQKPKSIAELKAMIHKKRTMR